MQHADSQAELTDWSACDPAELVAMMGTVVGPDQVSIELPDRALAGADLVRWDGQVVPDMVVRPADTEQVTALIALAARAHRALVPRGAGLSYTGGVSAQVPTIALDLTRLDRIHVDPDNLFAIVGAGCTWQALAAKLEPHGLRAAIVAPISGSHSTVGGAVAQSVPGSMDAVLGVTAVLADGTVLRTGSWALPNSLAFSRQHGPDLTGMFIGDCGAFAVKTEIALRLETVKPVAFESYAFATSGALLAAMTAMLRAGFVARAIGFDQTKVEMARPRTLRDTLETVMSVARQAKSIGRLVRDLAALRKAPGELGTAPWSLHMTIIAATEAGAAAQAQAVRRLGDQHGSRIEAVVSKTLYDRPYSVRGFVGPDGERWVPVHGVFPLSCATAAMSAMEAALATRREEMDRLGVRANWLISSSGGYVVIEPMFYWSDALDPIHLHYLSERNRNRFGAAQANPRSRALVDQLRRELCGIMDEHGATHGQIGRFYRLLDAVEPGTAELLSRIKAALDPDHRMNPGVLGL